MTRKNENSGIYLFRLSDGVLALLDLQFFQELHPAKMPCFEALLENLKSYNAHLFQSQQSGIECIRFLLPLPSLLKCHIFFFLSSQCHLPTLCLGVLLSHALLPVKHTPKSMR